MTNQELIDTLRKASESQDKDNIALRMLLIMAAERMERLHLALYGEKMNQRIQELMEQAGIFENQYTTEKFAELIVRECANVLRAESERLYKLSAEEKDELFASNFEICAEKCVDNEVAIREHFGVEE